MRLGCSGWFGLFVVFGLVVSGLGFVIKGLAWVEGINAPQQAQLMAFGFFVDGLVINAFAFFWRDGASAHWIPNKVFWPVLLGIEFLLIQLGLLGVIHL